MQRLILILGLLGASLPLEASACEPTIEYRALLLEVYQSARAPFDSCKGSVSQYVYWKAIAECETRNGGANVGGGCRHAVGYETAAPRYEDWKHCEVLKPSNEERLSMLDAIAEERGIRKCAG